MLLVQGNTNLYYFRFIKTSALQTMTPQFKNLYLFLTDQKNILKLANCTEHTTLTQLILAVLLFYYLEKRDNSTSIHLLNLLTIKYNKTYFHKTG